MDDIKKKIIYIQKNEITEYNVYKKLSKMIKNEYNKDILHKIAEEEYKHYKFWKQYTKEDIKPSLFMIFKYYFIALLFGLTFALKLMENNEKNAQINYADIIKQIPSAEIILKDEEKHEKEILELIEEEKLHYVGSIVLGLNDALVELTGTLAGLTLAFQNSTTIVLAGAVTGIAATFSMSASEYLSKKSENKKNALKSSIYTGLAYIITVIFLISPYLIISNFVFALMLTIIIAIGIIFIFNFYISVVKDLHFIKRFMEMSIISLSVALLSFIVGYVVKITLGA